MPSNKNVFNTNYIMLPSALGIQEEADPPLRIFVQPDVYYKA